MRKIVFLYKVRVARQLRVALWFALHKTKHLALAMLYEVRLTLRFNI